MVVQGPDGCYGLRRVGCDVTCVTVDNRDGSDGTGEGDAGIDRTGVGWVYAGV